MKVDIESIIELDRLNMTKYFNDSGVQFDPDIRRNGLQKQIQQGASFVIIERDSRLVGYIEYVPEENDTVCVASIQVHPEYTHCFILRKMLSNAYHQLKNNYPSVMRSSVHKNNKLSQKLHKKLGFRPVSEDGDKIRFAANGQDLIACLSRYAC